MGEPRHWNLGATVAALNDAARWLEALGISTKGRLEEYQITLERLSNQGGPPTALDLNAFIEALEFIDIARLPCTLFEGRTRQIDQLRKIVKGAAMYTDAIDDSGRNYAFQFATAAWFQERGAVVDLEAPTDVSAKFDSVTLHVECKRPQVAEAVNRKIKEAMGWFDEHPWVAPAAVAIDLTKAANQTYVMAAGTTLDDVYSSIELARQSLRNAYGRYPGRLKKHDGKGRAVDAVFYRVRILAAAERPSRIETVTVWDILLLRSDMPQWGNRINSTELHKL
jgi:hypothetical protein